MQVFLDFLQKNKWAIALFFTTIVVVILVVWLRWWAFLVVPALAAAVYIGHLLDKGGIDAVKAFFGKMFSKRN